MNDKNYITPHGFEKLKEELHALLHIERPKLVETVTWAAGNGDRSENADYQYGKRRLRQIDSRVRFLQKKLEMAHVIDPTINRGDRVFFGATVCICEETGTLSTYCIVGQDEINLDRGWISWRSPMATALLGKKEGDEVTVKSPQGDRVVSIESVNYSALSEG